ncbi:MAG TPA: circularly permuted type 2 ATP-grasp protein, partial [Opitutales bacterium]|nr:circularly permuted type 2 ATP-grasp protein [Opitutales bacterium]
VAVVNAIGCGVADNRAILRYSDHIINFYLHEKPLLRTVPTFTCRDPDQAEHVYQNLSRMVVKPIHDLNTMQKYYGQRLDLAGMRDLRPALKRSPDLLVAQPLLAPSHAPRFQNGAFVSRSVFLRMFIILGDKPAVLPGGLTRQSLGKHESPRLTIMTGGIKDTWAPATAPAPFAAAAAVPEGAGGEFSIGSRVAETMYWMARYLERAENTARQLNTLEALRWDSLGREGQRLYWPLWRAVAGYADPAMRGREKPPADLPDVTRALVLDRTRPGSVHTCVRAAIENAAGIRDILTPELWQALNQLGLKLDEASARPGNVSRTRLREVSALVVDEIQRVSGAAERTMLHDEAWQFFRAGGWLERAIDTMAILQSLLGPEGRQMLGRIEEEADLSALLRVLCSLDAYRRTYHARAHLDRVAALMLAHPGNPSSVAHCLGRVRLALANLQAQRDLGPANPLMEALSRLEEACKNLAPESGLSADSSDRLGELRAQVEGVHQRLEDAYFSHQHFYAAGEQTSLEFH